MLFERSLEVEDGFFVIGCILNMSVIGFKRVALVARYYVEGLIYFQIQDNLLHLKDGVV